MAFAAPERAVDRLAASKRRPGGPMEAAKGFHQFKAGQHPVLRAPLRSRQAGHAMRRNLERHGKAA
jgi:hypothetical protein